MASWGPITVVFGLKKVNGVCGTSLPSSFAWAEKLRPTPTSLERGITGASSLTSASG